MEMTKAKGFIPFGLQYRRKSLEGLTIIKGTAFYG